MSVATSFAHAYWLAAALLLTGSTVSASASLPDSGAQDQLKYWSGHSLFRSPWVSAPASTVGRDGLGPNFNAHSCHACHQDGGSGQSPQAFVIRIGDSRSRELQRFFGEQIQPYAVADMEPELETTLVWSQKALNLHGQESELRVPVVHWTYSDALPAGPKPMSVLLAPPLYGIGLLNMIDDADILGFADPDDLDQDGISGRASWLPSGTDTAQLGRFGYKAEQADLVSQVAFALQKDLGLSTTIFPGQNCAEYQRACHEMPTGNGGPEDVELSDEKLELLVSFVGGLPPVYPARKLGGHPGKEIFREIGCNNCHRSVFALPEGSAGQGRLIYPYSDLLLHDLGPELSDNRVLVNAEPEEWRTTPLWGLRHKLAAPRIHLLHDGRARSVEEAILWHGGEASASRDRFLQLDEPLRSQLLDLLSQL